MRLVGTIDGIGTMSQHVEPGDVEQVKREWLLALSPERAAKIEFTIDKENDGNRHPEHGAPGEVQPGDPVGSAPAGSARS